MGDKPEDLITEWFSKASLADLNSGVGCPMCKHDGPYWVEPCRLHAHLQGVLEDKHTSDTALNDLSRQYGRVLELLELDWDEDPVSAIEDLQSELKALGAEQFEGITHAEQSIRGDQSPTPSSPDARGEGK